MSLQVILEQCSLVWADRVGIVEDNTQLTYGELGGLYRRTSSWLKQLTGKAKPRVAALIGNRWEYIAVDFACAYGGAELVRTNARDSAGDLAFLLENSEADCLVYAAEFAQTVKEALAAMQNPERVMKVELPLSSAAGRREAFEEMLSGFAEDPIVDIQEHDTYKLMYTSGTTGRPKGVMVTHDQWMTAVLKNLYLGPLHDVRDNDCFLHITPLTHVSGGLFWAFMMRGCRQVIGRGTQIEDICADVERWQVTRMFLVPTLVARIVETTAEQQTILRRLERVYYAASPIGLQTLSRAVDLFGPIFAQGYGSTEAMWWLTYFHPAEHEVALRSGNHERLTSCGRPSFGVELRIVGEDGQTLGPGEIGEVATRGRHVATTYYGLGEVPRDANIGPGWFRTGDVGYRDAEGFIYLVDRKNNLIISGGFNVYPGEVESVLQGCLGVAECCIIGAPDEQWGEVVVAIIVRAAGAQLSESDVLAFGKANLADYKRPRRIAFRDELPTNSGGKIDRRQLRAEFWKGSTRNI